MIGRKLERRILDDLLQSNKAELRPICYYGCIIFVGAFWMIVTKSFVSLISILSKG